MKLFAELLNSSLLNSVATYSIVPVLFVGLILGLKLGSIGWLALLISGLLMIIPLAYRRSLDWMALHRYEKATPYYKRGDGYFGQRGV